MTAGGRMTTGGETMVSGRMMDGRTITGQISNADEIITLKK